HERLKPLQVRHFGRGRYQYQKARRFPGYEGLTSEGMAFQEDRPVRQRNNIEGPEKAYQNPPAALCFHFAEIVNAKRAAPIDLIAIGTILLNDVAEGAESTSRQGLRSQDPRLTHRSILHPAK